MATKSVAIAPDAPSLFSTTTGWPRVRDISLATRRAITSVEPPGEKGTISLTGLFGKSSAVCAWVTGCPRARVAVAKGRFVQFTFVSDPSASEGAPIEKNLLVWVVFF